MVIAVRAHCNPLDIYNLYIHIPVTCKHSTKDCNKAPPTVTKPVYQLHKISLDLYIIISLLISLIYSSYIKVPIYSVHRFT